MTKWKPTPEDERMTALRLVGDEWVPCQYSDIREGDIFRGVEDGVIVNVYTQDVDSESVALATGDAIKNDPLGSTGQWYGYGVPCTIFPSMDELKKGSN